MNIVTPYPTAIPINTVNVTTESARRDNQLREMIAKPTATEAGVAERGVASEHDKSSKPQQQGDFQVNLSRAEDHQKISEKGGQSEQGSQEQQKEKEKEQAQQQLAKVEKELQRQDQQAVRQLQSRDTEVRAHEQAHAAVGGRYAGSPTYDFKRGPDGRNYAVGGEVQIDSSPVAGDPKATIDKMQQVRAAALAPAEPSGQDRKVAAQANQIMTQARADQAQQQADEVQQAAKARSDESGETTESQAVDSESDQTQSTQAQSTQTQNNGETQTSTANNPRAAQAFAQNQSSSAGEIDPFSILFGEQDNTSSTNGTSANSSSAQTLGDIFGSAGAPGGENRAQVEANRAAAQDRNADVVARAGRIESFYASSTVPRDSGFSQFA